MGRLLCISPSPPPLSLARSLAWASEWEEERGMSGKSMTGRVSVAG
jgi:hypothetical protein